MNKLYLKLASVGAIVGGLLGAGKASAVLFDLPSTAITSTTAYIGNLFTDLGVFIWLAIGLPLGFYVIRKVISMVAGRAR